MSVTLWKIDCPDKIKICACSVKKLYRVVGMREANHIFGSPYFWKWLALSFSDSVINVTLGYIK